MDSSLGTVSQFAVALLGFLNLTSATTISKFPFTASVAEDIESRAVANRDIRYDVWSNSQRILFRLDPVYNETQRAIILNAINQITDDMFNCIRFTPYNPVTDSREDHIVISPTMNSGTTSTCSSFPGRVISQNARGQKLIIFGGSAGGCMFSKRDVMAIIIPVLGLRQEYRRPDRDTHIQTFPNNIRAEFQSLDLLRKYDSTMVESSSPFDFESITMPSQNRFVNPNSLLFVPRKEGQKTGEFARLSQGDCRGLKKIYPTCSRIVCSNPYNMTLPAEDMPLDANALGVATVVDKNTTATRRPRPARRPTTTTAEPEVPRNDLFADEGTPLEPPFNGLEFWLDPAKKTN